MRLEFSICHYNPDVDDAPRMQNYILEVEGGCDIMLLDAFTQLREKDPSLSFRRSCREGVYGSGGLNMNGKNGLVCIIPISVLNQPGKKIVIHPLLGLPVTRDLVVDIGQFYTQYERTKPYLLNNGQNPPAREYSQMLEQCEKLDGLYECTLCAYCLTSCPSSWWNSDKFIGPVDLLAAYCFLIDSRDTEADNRLDGSSDAFSIFHCHSITNCTNVCPKGPNPTRVIGHIRSMLLQRNA